MSNIPNQVEKSKLTIISIDPCWIDVQCECGHVGVIDADDPRPDIYCPKCDRFSRLPESAGAA